MASLSGGSSGKTHDYNFTNDQAFGGGSLKPCSRLPDWAALGFP